MKKPRLSRISALHYYKLIFRSLLFVTATVLYVIGRIRGQGDLFGEVRRVPAFAGFIWLVFFVEMIWRFFPSKMESMGCQKQFHENYVPTGDAPEKTPVGRKLSVAAVWLLLNGIFGLLYYLGIFDAGLLLLISLAYSVCDMICILFFCPFQTWFLKNKCCGSCYIYNWDYAMMFTPLVFIPDVFTWSLFGLALLLLLVFEIAQLCHPERFSEASNACLSCEKCEEKLCHHKRQLRHFIQKNKHLFFKKKK